MITAKKYVSLSGLSRTLRLPKDYLLNHIHKGNIPYLQVGKQFRFDEGQVRDALNRIAEREAQQQVQEPAQ